MINKFLILSIVLTTTMILSGCGANKDNATNNAPPADNGATTAASDPETIYKQNCTSCHGVNLNQRANANLSNVGSRLSKDEIAMKIANGGGGMIAFKNRLKADEIDALANWLAAKK
jgi:mono/diheme cytochrome c family protein